MDIQDPPSGIFSALDLTWKWVNDSHSYNKVARETNISWERCDDFIKGESKNPQHPTSFYKYSHHKNKSEVKKTPWKEKITYWCAYGPSASRQRNVKDTPTQRSKRAWLQVSFYNKSTC